MLTRKLVEILIILSVFSCAKAIKSPFILSDAPNLRNLERQDHQFCESINTNYNEKELLKSLSYWDCRLSIAKHHLINSQDPSAIPYNQQINGLVKRIDIQINLLPENLIFNSNSKIDKIQHKKCLQLGYEIATQNQAKIDDYFACRESLITEYKLIPPFYNAKYLEYPNKDYNINFALNQKIKQDKLEYDKQKEEYPNCVKFNQYNINFKNCTAAYDNSRSCFAQIDKKRYKKELVEKINCQKRAYVEFPKSLIEENELEEDDTNNINSDYYNQNSLASLGLSESDFAGTKKSNNEDLLDEDEPMSFTDINNNSHLYSKFEVAKLRELYIIKCQKSVDVEIEKYIKFLTHDCEELKKFEVIGEEE